MSDFFVFGEVDVVYMVNRGIEIVTEAIELDNAGKYHEALETYGKAMHFLMTGLKRKLSPLGCWRMCLCIAGR